MRIRQQFSILLPTCAAALFLACIGNYNPFSDMENAGISIIRQSITDGDTVRLFSSETLSVMVTVKEKTDRFTVTTRNNRRFGGSDSTIVNGQFSSEPFTFFFSFTDTGSNYITLTAYRSDGSEQHDTIGFLVVSPLAQPPVTGYYGEPVRLKTPPVADHDVDYVWSFGAGSQFSSLPCSTSAVVLSASPSGSGSLWVTDGTHRSPATPFTFVLGDTTGPVIVCANEGFVGRDTVFTSDSTAAVFKVRITDRGDGSVDSASINSAKFSYVNNNVYYSFVDSIRGHSASNPLPLDIYALDRFGFGNDTLKRFWIAFVDTVTLLPRIALTVTLPAGDSVSTGASTYLLAGTLECLSADTLTVMLHIIFNDSLISLPLSVRSTPRAWSRPLVLAPANNGANTVRIRVTVPLGNDTLARADRLLRYSPSIPDSQPPLILDITADGAPADNFYSTHRTVQFRVKAIDEGSAIASVTVGGQPATPDSTGLWFSDSVMLLHGTVGNEILITATDGRGNSADRTALLFYNRPPVFSRVPVSRSIVTDSLYTDSLAVTDADGDSILITLQAGPQSMVVTTTGSISWLPTVTDTGNHSIVLKAFDGYKPVFITYQIHVSRPSNKPKPLHFVTTEQNFPRFLEAGLDSMVVTLNVESGSGVPPFRYSARIAGYTAMLISNSVSNRLGWKPVPADSGFRQLIVTAADNFGGSDTLYPQILVVPANRPCSLSILFKSPTRSDGAIDLNARARPDTLTYAIFDPDNALIEEQTLSIYQARSKTKSVIDSISSDTFTLVLDPAAFNGFDTIVAIVRDHGGLSDTLVSVLFYGQPPDSARSFIPLNNAAAIDTPVTMFWAGSDPDNDNVYYNVYMGTSAASMTLRASVTQSSAMVRGLNRGTLYYWRVDTHDWKSTTPGPLLRFTTRP